MTVPKHFTRVLSLLKKEVEGFEEAMSEIIAQESSDPFQVLISCIMSLRTKDTTTLPAARRLFAIADTPEKMMKMSLKQIEKAIYPVGFYITKAKYIKKTCEMLVKDYGGKVPQQEQELLKLPGIGRKCMGITMGCGFGIHEQIPVDTHVFKLANRLGWVETKTPEETEFALMDSIPKKDWQDMNHVLVLHGQNVCVPISPFCSKCAVEKYCPKVGITSSR